MAHRREISARSRNRPLFTKHLVFAATFLATLRCAVLRLHVFHLHLQYRLIVPTTMIRSLTRQVCASLKQIGHSHFSISKSSECPHILSGFDLMPSPWLASRSEFFRLSLFPSLTPRNLFYPSNSRSHASLSAHVFKDADPLAVRIPPSPSLAYVCEPMPTLRRVSSVKTMSVLP